MTFEQAGEQFAALEARYRAGQLTEPIFQQMVAELRIQDGNGNWWQIEPESAQWMTWNGSSWVWPQAAADQAPVAQASQPVAPAANAATLTVNKARTAPAIWEGVAPVLPGLVVGLAQGWSLYSKQPAMLASFVIPSLLPGVLMPLTPKIGRVLAELVVVVCLVWLSWPVITQLQAILGHAQMVQAQAGRGLVGLSLLYLIPRIWRIRS